MNEHGIKVNFFLLCFVLFQISCECNIYKREYVLNTSNHVVFVEEEEINKKNSERKNKSTRNLQFLHSF